MSLFRALPLLMGIALQATTSFAADCDGYGVGNQGVGSCAGRTANYVDRATFCPEFAGRPTWYSVCESGSNFNCHFEYEGPGMDEQMCWDAYQNIIDQCFNHQNGGGYHYGKWELDGHQFAIDRCSLSKVLDY